MDDKIIINKVKEYLSQLEMDYDMKRGFKVRLDKKSELMDNTIADVYTVSFWQIFFVPEIFFAILDAKTLKLYYIMGPTQLIYPPK